MCFPFLVAFCTFLLSQLSFSGLSCLFHMLIFFLVVSFSSKFRVSKLSFAFLTLVVFLSFFIVVVFFLSLFFCFSHFSRVFRILVVFFLN